MRRVAISAQQGDLFAPPPPREPSVVQPEVEAEPPPQAEEPPPIVPAPRRPRMGAIARATTRKHVARGWPGEVRSRAWWDYVFAYRDEDWGDEL